MNKSEFAGNELNKIDSSTDIYDAFDPIIKRKVKEPGTFAKILKITKEFMTKNDYKLNTNIVGKQVLVNAKMENDIFEALDMKRDEVKKVMLNSPFFKKFGGELSITNQLCVAIPLILASLEYKRINKQEESKLCYLLSFYKPYASRESLFFKYGVKEDQMLYTVEHLSERFDLKRLGTISNVISKIAEVSYMNYMELVANDYKLTDKEIYVIYTSGVATRVQAFVNGIATEYRKNEGKSLGFDSPANEVADKDDDSTDFEDADIASDAAVKTMVVNKTLNKITATPVDRTIATIAARAGFESSGQQYFQILVSVIEETTDKMSKELPLFFSSLIGAFLFRINPKTGERYTMNEFKTPVFINVGVDILAGKKSNLKEVDMKNARTIFKKMVEEHSSQYMNFGTTMKRKFEKALAFYWVFLIKSCKY